MRTRLVFCLSTIVIVLSLTRSIQAATAVFNDRALFLAAVPAGLTEGFETFPTDNCARGSTRLPSLVTDLFTVQTVPTGFVCTETAAGDITDPHPTDGS